MTDSTDSLVAALNRRVAGRLEETVKLVVTDRGTLWLDRDGARIVDEDAGTADVTLTASETVFRDLFDGTRNPMAAVMTGSLKIDGSMATAMRIGKALMG